MLYPSCWCGTLLTRMSDPLGGIRSCTLGPGLTPLRCRPLILNLRRFRAFLRTRVTSVLALVTTGSVLTVVRTDSGSSLPSLLRSFFSVTVILAGSAVSLRAQEPDPEKKTIFESISIDESGHVCYMEALDENPLNRIEYRTNGKDVLYVYATAGGMAKMVEVTDLNSDQSPDLIHVEWMREDGSVVKTNFYRGPAYREHLRRHLQHALTTTYH